MKHIYKLWLIGLICGLTTQVNSQVNIGYKVNDSIKVTNGTQTLDNPWAGGINSPQFSQVDLNQDNQLDLIVFDRNGNTLKTFVNEGVNGVMAYRHVPKYQRQFPEARQFVQMRDYNCDGKMDFFTYSTGGFEVHQNITQNTDTALYWQQVTPLHMLTEVGSQVYNLPEDVAAIDDIDGDGDLDVLAFGPGVYQNFVSYYQNISVDSGWGCDSLRFVTNNLCWGSFAELPQDFTILLGVSCKTGSLDEGNPSGTPGMGASRAHAGSTLLTLDIDADNDKDLILGDISYSYLQLLHNGGDQFTSTITQVDSGYPGNTLPVNIPLFPASYYLDVDNDNINDLLVGPNTNEPSSSINNSWLYKNNGANNLPDFQFSQNDFLNSDMIDLGAGCHPTLVDVDGDGLLDLIAGNLSSKNPMATDTSRLAYYRNNGTALFPSFEWVSNDFGGLSQYGLLGIYPTFGDIDNDGDQDLVIGDREGELHYFENTAGTGNPIVLALSQVNYMSIDIGEHAAPQLVDLNRDNLLDLVIGERDGFINYFENTGSATLAQFDSVPTIDTLGGVSVAVPGFPGFSSPFVTDKLDSSGNYFLVVSDYEGLVRVFDNVEGNLNGNFTVLDSIFTSGSQVSVTMGFLEGDSLINIVTGELAGGLQIWSKRDSIPIGIQGQPNPWSAIKVYPNPATNFLTVEYYARFPHQLTADLVDITGRHTRMMQTTVQAGPQRLQNLDISTLAPGIYFLRLSTEERFEVVRFVKQ